MENRIFMLSDGSDKSDGRDLSGTRQYLGWILWNTGFMMKEKE